jgi:hypothetical protein
MLVSCHNTTWHHNPEGNGLNFYRRGNLKFRDRVCVAQEQEMHTGFWETGTWKSETDM